MAASESLVCAVVAAAQWNCGTWDKYITMASKTRFVYVLQPCYTFIVSGGSDGVLKVWDRVTGDPVGGFIGV
jgi:hypothetical protein